MGSSPLVVRGVLLPLLLGVGLSGVPACGRWLPAQNYQVTHQADPVDSFQAVESVVKAEDYQVIERSDEARVIKLRAHVDESSDSRVSYITVSVGSTGEVLLTPSGYLVRDNGTIHKRLDEELASLGGRIAGSLSRMAERTPAAPSVTAARSAPPATSAGLPQAWSEPASDTAKWGPGSFTCLPVSIPTSDLGVIGLRLSNGELARVTLSLAYDASLCRAPAACPHAEGCPALGIGDAEQVRTLAQRLSSNEIAGTATLLYRGQPTVLVDLKQHGSVAQALGQTPISPQSRPAD